MKNSVYREGAWVVAQDCPCLAQSCGFTREVWEGSLFGDDGEVHSTWFTVLLLLRLKLLHTIAG